MLYTTIVIEIVICHQWGETVACMYSRCLQPSSIWGEDALGCAGPWGVPGTFAVLTWECASCFLWGASLTPSQNWNAEGCWFACGSYSDCCMHLERTHSFNKNKITHSRFLIIRELKIHFVSCVRYMLITGQKPILTWTLANIS